MTCSARNGSNYGRQDGGEHDAFHIEQGVVGYGLALQVLLLVGAFCILKRRLDTAMRPQLDTTDGFHVFKLARWILQVKKMRLVKTNESSRADGCSRKIGRGECPAAQQKSLPSSWKLKKSPR
jgi:hypothetical protein